MKTKYILFSIVSILTLILLTGCYTSFGTVRHHQVYEEEVEYVEEDETFSTVNVYHHYYSRPYYQRFVYYDPYDYWYDEPGFYTSIGYYHRPYYHYSYYYGCVYPGWYPEVYRPYYVPVWYYDSVYPKPLYSYKRRDFNKRRDFAGRRSIDRDSRNSKRKNNPTYVSGTDSQSDGENYGRRLVSRRGGSGIDKDKTPIIARLSSRTISKRKTDRLPERSIKTRPVTEKRSSRIERSRNTSDRYQVRSRKKYVSKNNKPVEKITRQVQRRPNTSRKSYQSGNHESSKKVKTKSHSNSVRKSRNYDAGKNNSSRSSSYSRPKVRESNKSSVSKQSKRSSSYRSSYDTKKSKSTSSSNSNRKRGRR